MDNIIKYFGVVFAAMALFVANLPALYIALIVTLCADLLSSLLRAVYNKSVAGDSIRKITAQKITIVLVVALTHYLKIAANLPIDLGSVVAGFYLYGELVSVVENAAAIGLPIPDALKKVIAVMNENQTSATNDAELLDAIPPRPYDKGL